MIAVAVALMAVGVGTWFVLGRGVAEPAAAAGTAGAAAVPASASPAAPGVTVPASAPAGSAAPGVTVPSRSRVQAINRMNEGIQRFDANDVAGAEQALREAIQIDPSYAAANHTLGQFFRKQNRLAEAEAAIQAAVAQMGAEPQADFVYDLGAVQTALGDAEAPDLREPRYRAAIRSFQEALKLDPTRYKALYRIGTLYEKLAMFAEAEEAYRKTTALEPTYSPGFVSLGNMLLDRGDRDAAMAVLAQGAALNGTDARMWIGLGRAEFQLGRMDEAIEAYAKAKAIDPDAVDALYGLGMAYSARGMGKESAENLGLFLAKAGPETRPDLLAAARETLTRVQASR